MIAAKQGEGKCWANQEGVVGGRKGRKGRSGRPERQGRVSRVLCRVGGDSEGRVIGKIVNWSRRVGEFSEWLTEKWGIVFGGGEPYFDWGGRE